jgi:predicted ATPase
MDRPSLTDLRRRVSSLEGQKALHEKRKRDLDAEREATQEYLDLSGEIDKTLKALTDNLLGMQAKVIENHLTLALQEVLEQPVRLVTERDVKRGRMNLLFAIERDGQREDIMKGQGGSVANILSVGLRLFALTSLGSQAHRRFLVLDEQDCWLRPDLVPRFVKIVHDAGRALGYQILMISHHREETFTSYADRIFRLQPAADGVEVTVSEPNPRVMDV